MEVKSQIEKARALANGPFFLYDLDALAAHLRGISAEGVRLWYACKANPLGAILDVCHDAGLSFDVASKGELAQVKSRGVVGKQILMTGPSRPANLLSQALDAGLETFVIESPNQFSELVQEAARRKIKVRALLRLQLDWEGEGSSVLGGTKVTPFGIDSSEWRRFGPASSEFVEVIGFHAFQWGNILSAARLEEIWQRVAREASLLAKDLGIELKVLDLGGGIGIPYDGKSAPLAWQEVRAALLRVRAEFSLPEVWLELGRYAVGDFGSYTASVVDRKTVRGKEVLVLDGGINHLARPALVQESFPATLLRGSRAEAMAFGVHGPLCTSLDHFGDYLLPNDIARGDQIIFSKCGAYGFTESMPYFLGHDLPAEIILQKGELSLARKAESPATWMK